MLRRHFVMFMAVAGIAVLSAPANARTESPTRLVASFQAALVDVMQNAEKLGISGRYERLQPVIEDTFDLPLMAALAAGDHWKTASRTQRERLVDAFTRMSVATLATLFDGYSGQVFSVINERPGPQGLRFVDTELTSPGSDDEIVISYVARPNGGRWWLVDVIVDGGISELKVRISEYRRTLNTGGVEALIELLNGKAAQLLG